MRQVVSEYALVEIEKSLNMDVIAERVLRGIEMVERAAGEGPGFGADIGGVDTIGSGDNIVQILVSKYDIAITFVIS